MPGNTSPIRAVIFDFDGTLTLPGALDFPAIKRDLGCPADQPVLEHVRGLTDNSARLAASEYLERFEIEAAVKSRANTGAEAIVRWLRQRGLATGIITRNSRASVLTALAHFEHLTTDDFHVIVTRDDPPAPKPSGEGLLWAARRLGILPASMLMIGDYIFDCQAGRAAGCRTVLLDPLDAPHLRSVDCDARIKSLKEIEALVCKPIQAQ